MEHKRPMSLMDEDRQPQGTTSSAATFREKAEAIEMLGALLRLPDQPHPESLGKCAGALLEHLRANQLAQSLVAIEQLARKIQASISEGTQINGSDTDELAALVEVMGQLSDARPETA